MSPNPSSPPQFLILLRHGGTPPTPAELGALMAKFQVWMEGIKARGGFVAANGLEFTGKVIRTLGAMSDGPYAEAKEIVGGYIIIAARDITHAAEIAKGCPGLQQP